MGAADVTRLGRVSVAFELNRDDVNQGLYMKEMFCCATAGPERSL